MKTIMMVTVIAAMIAWAAVPSSAADSKEVYDKSCAACHGKTGKGDTPAGKKAKVKDYTDAQVQAAMKDEEMFKAIKEGVKEGDKVKMKGYGDKLSDDEIKALVAYIRTLKQ